MDNNYLWEIFTNKQNISEDHNDHHHHLLQIPNFQLNGFSQQDNQIHNQDLIKDPGGSSVITSQFQSNGDLIKDPSGSSVITSQFKSNGDLIKDPVGSSVITSQFQSNSDQLYKSSTYSTTPWFQTNCDKLYKASTSSRSTSIIAPQFQTSSDLLYKSPISTRSASIIAPEFQTNCDKRYKSIVKKSTSIIMSGQFQISCDRLYKSSLGEKSTNVNNAKEGLRSDESNNLKKVAHRNIERHRRQEMANLVTSLRSLIPIEFIKDKRSASDHMQVAVNYIKHLQKNIQDLDNTRKNIKNIISLDDQNKNCVRVNKCEDGMEILMNVNNSYKGEMFYLSKVLRWLLEQGLNVVTCVNSKQDEWNLIRIQCQVNDISSGLTVTELQKKLTLVIN